MYFPLFTDLTKKEILVVGAGAIGSRRIKTLLPFAGSITVIAEEIPEELVKHCEENGGETVVVFLEKSFEEADLEGADMVLAATSDKALNARIYELCKERGIPANDASDKNLCDFHFPSIINDGNIVIGIGASGTDHGKVKETRIFLEEALKSRK